MRTRYGFGLVFAALLAGSQAVAQTTWYVDVHATPPGNGTQATPYVSIAQAITAPTTHTGDTILVAPGTYVQNVTVQSTGVFVRSSSGPLSTTIRGQILLDGFQGGSGPAFLEGFTLENSGGGGVSMGAATLRRCIVLNTGPVPNSRGIFYDDLSRVENCVISGFEDALQMFFFASLGAEVRDTIVIGNGHMIGTASRADFINCCLPVVPAGIGLTQVNTILGDPGCWNSALRDFHLRSNSPCIDTGDSASQHDPDGSISDIGALPFDPSYLPPARVYCTSEVNGDGCLGQMQASGACSVTSSTPFVLTAIGMPPTKLVRLLYSSTQANIPFQGGTLCLGGQLHRTDPTHTSTNGLPPPLDACSGTASFDFQARVLSGIDPELVPGRAVYAQFRYRDPQDPLGFGVGWTDAVQFAIVP